MRKPPGTLGLKQFGLKIIFAIFDNIRCVLFSSSPLVVVSVHGVMAKLSNKIACIGLILMPTRKVLTRNDLGQVISGHNFVVVGAFGLEIRDCSTN